MRKNPDLEVVFYFNGIRKNPIYTGYRPAHRVTESYLATGIHHYCDNESIPPNGIVRGTITFLTPDAYPGSCWIGKEIPIQEASKLVGYAKVTKVLNPNLLKKNL